MDRSDSDISPMPKVEMVDSNDLQETTDFFRPVSGDTERSNTQ